MKTLKNTVAVGLLLLSLCLATFADGEIPIGGYQCNPAVEQCPPPQCNPAVEQCPDGGSGNRSASPSPSVSDEILKLVKKYLGL